MLPNLPAPNAKVVPEPTRGKYGLVAAVAVPPPVPLKKRLLPPLVLAVFRGLRNTTAPFTTSGRLSPAPVSDRSVDSTTSNGLPVWAENMPVISNPPNNLPIAPFWLLYQGSS